MAPKNESYWDRLLTAVAATIGQRNITPWFVLTSLSIVAQYLCVSSRFLLVLLVRDEVHVASVKYSAVIPIRVSAYAVCVSVERGPRLTVGV